MWEAQHETMTRHERNYDKNSDLGQVTGERFSVRAVANQPKLKAKKLDTERPDSCFRRPSAETLADLGQVTGEHQRVGQLVMTGVGQR